MDVVAELSLGALVALLIIKEVLAFVRTRNGASNDSSKKRPITGPKPSMPKSHPSIEAITDRQDRMITRLDEIIELSRETRKQAELNGEANEKLQRSIVALSQTMDKIEHARRRQTGPVAID